MRAGGESWWTYMARKVRLRVRYWFWQHIGDRLMAREPYHVLEETPAMRERSAVGRRVGTTDGQWFFPTGGYGELVFRNILGASIPPYYVAYVALPPWHPDVGRRYDDLPGYGPAVNGGLTYADGNVFGWDYAHGWNRGVLAPTVELDVERALAYFKGRDPRQPLIRRLGWWWEWEGKRRAREAKGRLKRAWAKFEGPPTSLRREEA